MTDRLAHLGRGLWGILATPFAGPDCRVDEVSLRREVALFRDLSATGLVALGVFGEGAALDAAEQRQVVTTVVDEARKLPVVVGLSARHKRGGVPDRRDWDTAEPHHRRSASTQDRVNWARAERSEALN